MAVGIRDEPEPTLNMSLFMERPGTLTRIVTPQTPAKPIVIKWNCKSMAGSQEANNGFLGNSGTGSDPSDLRQFVIALATLDGALFTGSSPTYAIEIWYKVLVSDRKLLAQS